MTATEFTLPEQALAALPCDKEAEVCTIGSMLLDEGCIPGVRAVLAAADFYDSRNRAIFDAICRLADDGQPIDAVMIRPLLTRQEDFDLCGGDDYFEGVLSGVPSSSAAEHYARRVKDAGVLRAAIGIADNLRREALSPRADADALADVMQAGLDSLRSSTSCCRPAIIARPLSAADLLAQFPRQREPIIDGLLRRGEVGNFISAPKMYKSWMLLYVCLCVATGRDVFRFRTRPGRVLLLDFELAAGTLAKRLQAVAEAMQIPPDDLGDSLAIHPMRGRQMDVAALGAYLAALPPKRFDLVVIDPLYKLFGPDDDENSNIAFAHLFGRLQSLAEGLNVGVLTIHHLSKGDQSFKSVTDLGSGGGSQARAADAHLALRSHAEEGAAVLAGVLRSFPPFAAFCIRWKYPLWELAPDLDPADLRRPTKRTAVKAQVPPKPSFDPAWMAREVLSDKPLTRDSIVALAVEAGVPNQNQAKGLLSRAEATGKAYRWRLPKDNRSYFASVLQPVLVEAK